MIKWQAHGSRRQDSGCLSSSDSHLVITETGRQAPKITRDKGILSKWGYLSFHIVLGLIPFVLQPEISFYSSSLPPHHRPFYQWQWNTLYLLILIIMGSDF